MNPKILDRTEGDFLSVEEIRFLNCRRLIKAYNLKIIEFAEMINKTPSHTGMLAGLGEYSILISKDTARHIEKCFLLPKNFLDNIHDFDSEETMGMLQVDNLRTLRDSYLAERALALKNGFEEFIMAEKTLLSSITFDRMSETVEKSFSLKNTMNCHDLLERINTEFTFAELNALAVHIVDFLSRDTAIKITKKYNKG